MLRIDFYVQHLLRHNADAVDLISGKPVRFRFPTGARESNKPLTHVQLERMIEEAAPPAALQELEGSRKARFLYRSSAGIAVTVRMETRDAQLRVRIRPYVNKEEVRQTGERQTAAGRARAMSPRDIAIGESETVGLSRAAEPMSTPPVLGLPPLSIPTYAPPPDPTPRAVDPKPALALADAPAQEAAAEVSRVHGVKVETNEETVLDSSAAEVPFDSAQTLDEGDDETDDASDAPVLETVEETLDAFEDVVDDHLEVEVEELADASDLEELSDAAEEPLTEEPPLTMEDAGPPSTIRPPTTPPPPPPVSHLASSIPPRLPTRKTLPAPLGKLQLKKRVVPFSAKEENAQRPRREEPVTADDHAMVTPDLVIKRSSPPVSPLLSVVADEPRNAPQQEEADATADATPSEESALLFMDEDDEPGTDRHQVIAERVADPATTTTAGHAAPDRVEPGPIEDDTALEATAPEPDVADGLDVTANQDVATESEVTELDSDEDLDIPAVAIPLVARKSAEPPALVESEAAETEEPKAMKADLPAEEVAPQEVAPQEVAPQEVAAQEVAPQEVAAQAVAPQEVAAQEVAPQEVAAQEVAPQEVAAEASTLLLPEFQRLAPAEVPADTSLERWLLAATAACATDVHLRVGQPPVARVGGELLVLEDRDALSTDEVDELLAPLANASILNDLRSAGSAEWCSDVSGVGRFRVNALRSRSGTGVVFRHIIAPRSLSDLGLERVDGWLQERSGLILVAGADGSGRTTTLSSLVAHINATRSGHIITIERPIEHVHEDQRCLITQREVGTHSDSFARAMHTVRREDADVVVISDLDDPSALRQATALVASGTLVIGVVSGVDVTSALDRIFDEGPTLRARIAKSLLGIVSQTLCRTTAQSNTVAFDVLPVTDGVRRLIGEGKSVKTALTNRRAGAQTMADHLASLIVAGVVNQEDAAASIQDEASLLDALRRAKRA